MKPQDYTRLTQKNIMDFQSDDFLKRLYNKRFSAEGLEYKKQLWKVFINTFLSKHIKKDDVLLDIGAGYCEFINNVDVSKKYVIDVNPDVKKYANKKVTVIQSSIFQPNEQIEKLEPLSCIFISNFFEHLTDFGFKQVIQVLAFCYSKLKTGGRLIIIQPNFKFCYREYYDFIDHHIPLTHLSMKEALETVNFKIEILYNRFLPYTTVGKKIPPEWLKLYLSLPFLWKIFGKQMFIKAIK